MILIKGGRLIDPRSGTDGLLDVVVEGDRISRIGKFQDDGKYERVIDAKGLVVAPGLVDVHVHFREPGFTHKEDISSGSLAAARGGFSTVVCMANTSPVVDNLETLRIVLEAASRSPINVKTVAAVSRGLLGRELTDMAELKQAGATGFSDDGIALTDAAFVHEAMRTAKDLDVPISLHEEDPTLLGTPGVNEGAVSALMGLVGAPSVSESSMVARDCMLALDTGCKTHMQHLSCAESVAAVRLAKHLGAHVSAEVTPHHFVLTEEAVTKQGTAAKVNPPLRSEKDRYALVMGLKDGTIDIIATDHAPHAADEKARPFAKAPSGLTGLETALALGITFLVRRGHLELSELIGKMSLAPAALYGLDAGFLAEGGQADIVIFDERADLAVKNFASKSTNSPFIDWQLFGKVKITLCGGEIVYSETGWMEESENNTFKEKGV